MTTTNECPPSGSTLDPDQGTPGTLGTTYPQDYASVRVTCSHIDLPRMLLKVFDGESYICYPHKGQKTHKEHCHVLIPDMDDAGRERLKKRLVRAGYKGNESYSIKGMHNGLDKGIQYASKEDTKPIVVGDFDEFISKAPKWEKQTSIHSHFAKEGPDKGLRHWQLNYSNLVPQAVHYAKVNKLGDLTLKCVVKHMLTHTKWRPCKAMIVGGVPDFYSNDFKFLMGTNAQPDMDWFCLRA